MRALVCGAGIAGLATTRLLAGAGWEVELVEQAPRPRGGGYMIDFFGPGYDAAEAMGLLPRLRELAYPISGVSYVDPRGRDRAHLDYGLARRALDGRLLSLMRGDLERTLHDGLAQDRRVSERYGCTVVAVAPRDDGAAVTLSDGSGHDVDLLVGADGIHSRVRALLIGPEDAVLRPLGFHTAAWLAHDPWLWRRLGPTFVLTDTVDRELGLYGLREEGVVATFAALRNDDVVLPPDPRAALADALGDLGGLARRALRTCPSPPDLYYDLVAQVVTDRWVEGRVVLVGDACQAVSLLAGQGASLAVAGAAVLADELARTSDVDSALRRYQDRMAPVAASTQAAGRRSAQWFLPSSRPRLLARRLALRAMALPGVDRLVAARLTGSAGVL